MRSATATREGSIRVTVWAPDERGARSQLIWILAELGRRLHRAELLTQGDGEFTFDCSTTSYQGQAASYAS
jgi:hypothetical protein